MELPNILNKITHANEQSGKEYFWALQIWDEGVKSAIWAVEGEKVKVFSLGGHEGWEETIEGLLSAVEKSFRRALENFVGECEKPTKVIFGLPNDWSEEERINAEKQKLLSYLCRQLDLKPVGFVSIFEAINHRLKEVEGVPLSAILINPGKKFINLAIVEVGQIKGVEKIVRSEDVGADVCEGLSRFSAIDTLPARILLFNGQDMEELQQILISYPWKTIQVGGKELPFLHLPKIEILPYDFDISAVAIAGGGEVAKNLGLPMAPIEETEGVKEEEKKEEEREEKEEEESGEDLGFVLEKDISLETKKEEEPSAFPKETPIIEKKFSLKGKLPSFHFSFRPRFPLNFPFAILGGGLLLLLFILGAAALYWNVPKAEILIYVTPQVLEKEVEITFDPNQEVLDEKNLVVPAGVVEVQESGEKTAPTTGEKTVGERAQGEVTIYNRTSAKKTFPAGTILVGPGGLKFTLDRETSVASKSPDPTGKPADIWGESKATITAVDIGAQYNLAAQSLFSIKDFPTDSFLAKNESALSGGTSRQIQAVAGDDQKTLLKDLSRELEEKGRKDLLGKIPEGKKLVEEGVLSSTVSSEFDHKVGDEAQALTLNLTLKVTGLVYGKGDFLKLSQTFLQGVIPPDYELKGEELEATFTLEKENKDGSMLFKTFLKANLLPRLDKKDIAKNIKGKYPHLAEQYLSRISGYAGSEIRLLPRLPGFLGTLPRREENISLEIRSK